MMGLAIHRSNRLFLQDFPIPPVPVPGAMSWLIMLIAGLVLFMANDVFAGQYKIAMITWRGETLAEKGFIDELRAGSHDILLTKYHADQDALRLENIITRIKKRSIEKPGFDIIYVFGTTATKLVLSRIKKTPVVFNIVTRPVGSGIIASWECSENNATGASNKVSAINQLKALKKVVDFKRLGMIYNPKELNSLIQRNNVKQLENLLGFKLTEYEIFREQDILKILPRIQGRVDAVFLPSDSMVKYLGKKIMEQVNAYKIPSLSSVGSMVLEDGVLLGFVPKYYELGKIAAKKAILILNGTKPCDIPSSVLDYYHILVNMKTAGKINVQIPMSVLVMANQIVR